MEVWRSELQAKMSSLLPLSNVLAGPTESGSKLRALQTLRRGERMPRRGECCKTISYFPKKYEEVVGHIQAEADFFTPSSRDSLHADYFAGGEQPRRLRSGRLARELQRRSAARG
jgi:hypothetical protein